MNIYREETLHFFLPKKKSHFCSSWRPSNYKSHSDTSNFDDIVVMQFAFANYENFLSYFRTVSSKIFNLEDLELRIVSNGGVSVGSYAKRGMVGQVQLYIGLPTDVKSHKGVSLFHDKIVTEKILA